MKHKKITLKNGVRLLTVPMPSLESATITVWVKTGSRNEEPRISGISHFLEHMVFKGSKKRPSARAISEAVDAMGGEFNAATSKEWTNFYIKARAASLPTSFDVLSDMVLNPLLRAEEIEREKGVIVEEIGMYEDTPAFRIGDVFEQLIFDGHSLGRDVIGSVKTVRGVKRNDFIRYRDTHYDAGSIVVTVAGGITEAEVKKLAEEYFGGLAKKSSKLKVEEFKNSQTKPRVKLHPKKKEQAHFILGFLGYPRGNENRFVEAVLASVLGGGMSSRLFSEIREKRGLAYSVRTSVDHYIETGYLATYAGVDPKKAHEAVKVMLDEHYGLASRKLPISNEELKKAKEFVRGHFALALEDTKKVNYAFGEDELLTGKVDTPEEVFEEVDKVTTEEIYELAKKMFVPERLNLAIIGPYKDQSDFEKAVNK